MNQRTQMNGARRRGKKQQQPNRIEKTNKPIGGWLKSEKGTYTSCFRGFWILQKKKEETTVLAEGK